MLDRNAAIAAANGFPMREAFIAEFRAVFLGSDRGATDLDAARPGSGRADGGGDILGFMLERARAAGVPEEIHDAALLHARVRPAAVGMQGDSRGRDRTRKLTRNITAFA